MSLKHAVLALLQAEEGSGYDLSKRFKSGMGYFWSASHQQIYQQLKKMLAEQLIDVREMPQVGKPDKKVYQITALGEALLRQWIESPCKASKVNDAFLVKLYAGDCVDRDMLQAKVVEQQQHHRQLLATFELLEAQYHGLTPQQRQAHKLPFITLRKGILGEQAWLAWSEEALQLLPS